MTPKSLHYKLGWKLTMETLRLLPAFFRPVKVETIWDQASRIAMRNNDDGEFAIGVLDAVKLYDKTGFIEEKS